MHRPVRSSTAVWSRESGQHLFAVLRDLVYIGTEIESTSRFDLSTSEGITDAVFHILKQAHVLVPDVKPNLVVCWGGHAISRIEYDYTKRGRLSPGAAPPGSRISARDVDPAR